MRCICCVCKILYNVKEPFEDDSETHGFCNECYDWLHNNQKIVAEREVSRENKTT